MSRNRRGGPGGATGVILKYATGIVTWIDKLAEPFPHGHSVEDWQARQVGQLAKISGHGAQLLKRDPVIGDVFRGLAQQHLQSLELFLAQFFG